MQTEFDPILQLVPTHSRTSALSPKTISAASQINFVELVQLEQQSLGAVFGDPVEALKLAIDISIKDALVHQCIFGNLELAYGKEQYAHPSDELLVYFNSQDDRTQTTFASTENVELPSQQLEQTVAYGKLFVACH